MTELATSMSSGISEDKTPLGIGQSQIIWPTVEDVRCSLEVVNKLVFHKYFFFSCVKLLSLIHWKRPNQRFSCLLNCVFIDLVATE